MELNHSYIKNLEIIGSGAFGKIYKDGDKIYKLYKEKIVDDYYKMYDNPALNYPKIKKYKLNRLKQVKGKIKNCNLAYDCIYIDGKFSGVVADYFDGDTLGNIKNKLSFDEKIKISKIIVTTMKKLQANGIYPLDIHLDNIMIGKDLEVCLIDLDDSLTKVKLIKNPFLKRQSLRSLNEALQDIFDEKTFTFYCNDEIERYKFPKEIYQIKPTYLGTEKYLDYKEKKEQVLFISQYTNIDRIKKLEKNKKIILIYDEYDLSAIRNIILELSEHKIFIDKILPKNFKEIYINDNNVIDYYDISNESTRYVLLKK